MSGFNKIDTEVIKPELNDKGYCDDCNSNYNCLNCNVMDNLILYNKNILRLIVTDKTKKSDTNIDSNINKKRYCGCGNILKGKYGMCNECYFKAKMSGEL